MGDSLPKELMDMDFDVDGIDLDMLVAGPADDHYNDLLDREVLQHLGLYDTAAGPSGAAAGSQQQPLLSFMSLGGAGASAAAQVASLLVGTHPSARGANLAEWLTGEMPVVSLSDGLAALNDAAASPAQQQEAPTAAPGLLPAAALSLPGIGGGPAAAPPQPQSPVAAVAPRVGAALPLQEQLRLQQQAASAAAAAAATAGQQQAMLMQLPGGLTAMCHSGAFFPGAVLPVWQQVPMALLPQLQMAQAQQALAEQAQFQAQVQAQLQQQQQTAPGVAAGAPGEMVQLLMGGGDPQSPDGSSIGISSAGMAATSSQHLLPVLSEGSPLPPLAMLGTSPVPVAAATSTGTAWTATASGLAAGLADAEEEQEEDMPEPSSSGGSGGAKPSNKKFSNRQKTRISAIEAELQKLQQDMQRMKVENQKLKEKNMEVERQLCTQEQLQQLATAAAVSSAAVAAAAATAQQQMLAGGLGTPPLAMAAAASPPNSQRKLLMHLTVSARPADAEMLKVAALTWPKLHEWYRQLYARFREVLAGSPPLSSVEAELAAKDAMRSGCYWDLLVLICRPDLSVRMLNEDFSVAPAPAPPPAGTPPPPAAAAWPPAALSVMELSAQQRGALSDTWRLHREAAAQRAQRKQELLAAIRSGFLHPLQAAAPEEVELGKPLARQGLEAMEALRLVVRQDHVSSVQVAAGVRKLLTPLQQARLAAAAWPFYPDPSRWAPLLVTEEEEEQQ